MMDKIVHSIISTIKTLVNNMQRHISKYQILFLIMQYSQRSLEEFEKSIGSYTTVIGIQ